MKNFTKLMMLTLGIMTAVVSYSKAKSSSSSATPPQTQAATKPMASTQTAEYTVTNTASSNVSVIFYDSFTKSLGSLTNLSTKQQLNIPAGAAYISVRSGSKEVITYASIKAVTSYAIMYINSAWTFNAV